MIYQVKGISGYVWGVYEFAPVCGGMHGCARGVCGCAGVCVDMHDVCGMNYQNSFLRIESLHQRTLICILYEFFLSSSSSSSFLVFFVLGLFTCSFM